MAGLIVVVLGCTSAPRVMRLSRLSRFPPRSWTSLGRNCSGYTFDTVYQMKVEGKVSYEIRGKDKRGKVRRGGSLKHRRSARDRMTNPQAVLPRSESPIRNVPESPFSSGWRAASSGSVANGPGRLAGAINTLV